MAGETVHRYGFEVWNAAGTAVVMSATTAGLLTVDKVTSGAGTVSLPAIYLNADTNTGWYHIGADNWGFAANGTKVLDISATAMSSVLNPTFTRGSSVTQAFNPAAAQDIQSAQKRTGLAFTAAAQYALANDSDSLSLGNGTKDSAATFFAMFHFVTAGILTQILSKTASSGGDEYALVIDASSRVQVSFYDFSASAYISAYTTAGIAAGYHTVFATYDGSGLASGVKIYVDFLLVASTTTGAGTYVAMENTTKKFAVAALNEGVTANGNIRIFRAGLLNYALPEDKIRRYSAGERLDWEDLNGSMTPINSVAADQDFSSDTGYWTKAAGVSIGSNICTFTNVVLGDGLYKTGVLVTGKSYRLKLKISSYTDGSIGLFNNSAYYTAISTKRNGVAVTTSLQTSGTVAANDIWEFEFTAINDTALRVYTGVAGTDLAIDNLTIIPLGALAAYEGENLLPSAATWPDSSGNNNDLTITGATTINLQDSLELTDKLIVGGTTTLGKSTASSPHLVYKGIRIDSNSGSDSRIEFTYAGAATQFTQYLYNPDTSLRWASGAGVDFLVLASTGDFWARGNVSALSFTDRTPFPESSAEALAAINSLERLPPAKYKKKNKGQQLDHSKVHAFLKGETADSRDLSATVSCLVVVVQDLLKEIELLKKPK